MFQMVARPFCFLKMFDNVSNTNNVRTVPSINERISMNTNYAK